LEYSIKFETENGCRFLFVIVALPIFLYVHLVSFYEFSSFYTFGFLFPVFLFLCLWFSFSSFPLFIPLVFFFHFSSFYAFGFLFPVLFFLYHWFSFSSFPLFFIGFIFSVFFFQFPPSFLL